MYDLAKMKFSVGDLVVRTTGGPAMLVIDNIDLTCQWVEGGRYCAQLFQESDLVTLTDWVVRAAERQKKARR